MNKQNELTEIKDVEFPVSYAPARIDFKGYEDFKAQVDDLHERLESYEVSEGNLKEAKSTRAKLNKAKKKINAQKIKITKQAEGPIKEFKDKVKVLVDEIDDSSSKISDQIKFYEDKARRERHDKNFEQIRAMCELENIGPDKIEYDSSWDNKSYSKTKFENEVNSQIALIKQRQNQLKEAILTVTQEADKLGLPAEHWVHELKLKSLPDVLKEMDEYKADLANIAEKQHETKVNEAKDMKIQGDHYIDAETGEVKEKVYTVRMEVKGSAWQMKQLKSFLQDNGIEFHSLEE